MTSPLLPFANWGMDATSPHRSRRTRRTVWLSDAEDRRTLASQGILPSRRAQTPSSQAGKAALPDAKRSKHEEFQRDTAMPRSTSPPNIPLRSLAQVRRVMETLTSCFPLVEQPDHHPSSAATPPPETGQKGTVGNGAVWIDLVHPSSREVHAVLSWLSTALPDLLRGTRHWLPLHVEDEEEERALAAAEERLEQHYRRSSHHAEMDNSPSTPAFPDADAAPEAADSFASDRKALFRAYNAVTHLDSRNTGMDHVEYYPSYGFGLLRFTALRDVELEERMREQRHQRRLDRQRRSRPPQTTGKDTRNNDEVLFPETDVEEAEEAEEEGLWPTRSGAVFEHKPEEKAIRVVGGFTPEEGGASQGKEGDRRSISSSSSSSSTSSTSTGRSASEDGHHSRDTPLVIVSAVLLEKAMITFRNGYLQNEDEVLPQLQWCMTSRCASPLRDAHRQPVSSPNVLLPGPYPSSVVSSTRPRSPHHVLALLLSTTLCAVVEEIQRASIPLLVETNTVDELALAMRPSVEDQVDLLGRMKRVRRRVHTQHVHLLRKERLLQQLLATLPPTVTRDQGGERCPSRTPQHGMSWREAAELEDRGAGEDWMDRMGSQEVLDRYLHALHVTRTAIEHIRRGRDTISLSSMSVISGVVARLGQHCHWMDYLSTLQSQISLMVMPINIIPGIMSCNVRVPFQNDTSRSIFWIIVGVTLTILFAGLAYPFYRYYRYVLPGSIAPSY